METPDVYEIVSSIETAAKDRSKYEKKVAEARDKYHTAQERLQDLDLPPGNHYVVTGFNSWDQTILHIHVRPDGVKLVEAHKPLRVSDLKFVEPEPCGRGDDATERELTEQWEPTCHHCGDC